MTAVISRIVAGRKKSDRDQAGGSISRFSRIEGLLYVALPLPYPSSPPSPLWCPLPLPTPSPPGPLPITPPSPPLLF